MKWLLSLCRSVGKIVTALAVFGAVLWGIFYGIQYYILSPLNPEDTSVKTIMIKEGTTFAATLKKLQKEGIIKRWEVLAVAAKLLRKERVQAGEYALSPSMQPLDILNMLNEGRVYKRKITFRECARAEELPQIVEQAGLASARDVINVLKDTSLLREFHISADSFEGYLLPDTYFFSRPISARKIVSTMLLASNRIWTKEYEERARQLGLTRHQVITLASIIESESGNFEEQPLISSVFHNRMKKGMRLESDPTAVYDLPGFSGIILKKHLRRDSPYNTYVIYGLPKGPICNPGRNAIHAALYPKKTDYLYFVADGKGGHIFSSNLASHNKAVTLYRRQKMLTDKN